jgi:hypothetical protein
LPAGKHAGILTEFQTQGKKKMEKNKLFLPSEMPDWILDAGSSMFDFY